MYTHFYANSRHDSYIDAKPEFNGKILWETNTVGIDEADNSNRLILTDGKNFYADALTVIICIDSTGRILWKRQKWYGSQMILKEGEIFYQSSERKDYLESVDSKNNIITTAFSIPNLIDESYLVLFEPDKKGIFAEVQYADLPEVSVPEFIVYRSDKGGLGYTWYKRFPNQINTIIPVVNFENNFLLTFNQTKGFIFNLTGKKKEVEPDYSFKLPENNNNIFASSSLDGDIYICWSTPEMITLKCYNSQAEEKYQVEFEREFFSNTGIILPPAITKNGYIFIAADGQLFCISDKKIQWSIEIPSIKYITAFADNSVLVAAGNLLLHINRYGSEIFRFEAESNITAPVILNKNNGAVFCTKYSIYSME